MVWQVYASRELDATAETVWAVLTDFEAYPDWNPTIRSVSGEPEVGATLSARLSFPNGLLAPIRPTVRVFDPERELRWEVALGGQGTIDADHSFRIQPLSDGRVEFEQIGRFEGVLATPLLGRSGDVVRSAMVQMNDALAERVAAVDAANGCDKV